MNQIVKGAKFMKKLTLVILGMAMIALAAGCKDTPKDESPAKEEPPKDHPAH
jgi:hypothetical protein